MLPEYSKATGFISWWTALRCRKPCGLRGAVVLLFICVAGCIEQETRRGPVRVWAVPELVTVFPDDPADLENEVYSDANQSISLSSAVNETVAFQLVLRGGSQRAAINAIELTPPRHEAAALPGEGIRLFREMTVAAIDYPAWYLRLTPHLRRLRAFPDILLPLNEGDGGLPIRLEPDETVVVWVDMQVPLGTEPGLYRSQLTVVTGGGSTRPLDVSLTVWPFALPQARNLPVIVGLEARKLVRHHVEVGGRPHTPQQISTEDPAYEQAVAVVDSAVRLLHEHRCDAVLTDVMPARHVGPSGEVELDWGDYDRLAASFIDGTAYEDRTPSPAWPIPVSHDRPDPDTYGGWGSGAYTQFLRRYLAGCGEHFARKGWLDQQFIWLPVPHDVEGSRYHGFQWLAGLVRQADPRLRLVCSLAPQSMAPYGWTTHPFVEVSPLVDIWCPPPALSDPVELARQQAAGKRVWLMPGDPPFSASLSMIASGVHARSVPWQAFRYGYDAVWLPAANVWSDDGLARADGSERALLWPGKTFGLDEAVPSIRLKRLRRGVQDFEYLWLLGRNDRAEIAQSIAADLFARGGADCYGEHFLDGRGRGWATDHRAWSLARRLMARELTASFQATGAEADTGAWEEVERFERQIEWARFIEAVRQVRTEFEGARVRFDPADRERPVIVEATISLFNATPEPFTGSIGFANLPETWSTLGEPTRVATLAPSHRTRRIVRARAATVEPDTEGTVDLGFSLIPEEGESAGFDGRLCVLTSQPIERPLVIDGDLSDWPLAINVASDFLLVGATDVPKTDRPSPDLASQLTTVFVGDDEHHLYIAFNCQESDMAGRIVTQSNYVRYDDLWPIGEDLVEVILDPTGEAVTASDLLHIVVKANGAVIAEHGAPCMDRVAPHSPWPIDVRAAVDDASQPDRWTVEMAIPLDALDGERNRVWGVNFARFDAQRGEYSSWTSARSYLYTPVALGNLRLPIR